MNVTVRAPATTANLGPGFDCAAAALDLWNELEVRDDENGEVDREHLAVQAFERVAPVDGLSFSFVDRIPRERGLGSSAATIALGLTAGALVAGDDRSVDELLALGLDLEGHPDNLAAALAGGVVLTWEGRVARVAEDAPAAAIAVVPGERVRTAAARASLPDSLPHEDAAFTAARAALLGAALSAGSADLFGAALDDRLHEPYRAPSVPLLDALRSRLPDGALGVTISGSGPSVIVWARREERDGCADELRERFPDTDVLPLAITPLGAGPL